MKKTIIITSFLMSFYSIFSQNTAGRIVYKIEIVTNDKLLEADKKFGIIADAINASKSIEYNLDFNNKESIFYQVEDLKVNPIAANTVNSFCTPFDLIYNNIDFKEILCEKNSYNSLFGKNDFVIKIETILNWELINETKYIDGFLCYKAKTLKTKKYLEKVYSEPVVAWYCPSLPYSFGPTQYSGLPGLILEIQEEKVTIGLKSIDFKKLVNIVKPTAKRIISLDEFYKITSEKIENMLQMAKDNDK